MPSEGERAPELLRADREQLDRAAEVLRGGDSALVIVVCAKPLVPAALQHLRTQASVEIPEPVVRQGSEEARNALVDALPASAGASVRSLALGGDAKEALRALNWHREKLLRGTPVVLWLDGVDGLTEMREAAPDAYSFRDMVVLVRGDGGRLPQVPHKESRTILEARRRLARAKTALERANAHGQLSAELRTHGFLVEAETVARRGLDAVSEAKHSDEDAGIARARLWLEIAMAAGERGSQAREQDAALRGLDEVRGRQTAGAQSIRSWLLVEVPGPIGNCDRVRAAEAFALARELQMNPSSRTRTARAVSQVACVMGDIVRARKLLDELDVRGNVPYNISILRMDQGRVMRAAGQMFEAERFFRQAVSVGKSDGAISVPGAMAVAEYWADRGELSVAEQIVAELALASEPTYLLRRQALEAAFALVKGELPDALEHAHAYRLGAVRFGLDNLYLNACGTLAQIGTEGYDARQLDAAALESIAVELEIAEDVSGSLTDHHPFPWFTIHLLAVRAAILIRTTHCSEALEFARRALDIARTACTDLIPECGRVLADYHLRTGNPDDALPVLAEVEPEAEGRGMLKELARIRAARVLALVLLSQPPGSVELAMKALRVALESTGAPRIKANTLLELAIRLPPATTLPDPLALATETHALFVEMPIPAKEARSLELAGDILVARGKPADAKRRYIMAHGILERRGLGLRLPLLQTKIAQLG